MGLSPSARDGAGAPPVDASRYFSCGYSCSTLTPRTWLPAARSFVVISETQVGMVGDAQVGKTTLMVKYVENKFDEEYIMTLGERESKRR